MSSSITVSVLCGSKRLVQVSESRPDGLWLGGYAITYDSDGVEVERSPVEWNCRLFTDAQIGGSQ